MNEINNSSFDEYVSSDGAMQQCLQLARAASRTDLPILILGESGTGKTLLAEAIHRSSKRGQAPFVSFNASALSDTLLDSQLFGHEKGAFTDAERLVKGKFELADHGTLFLDEIADMSATAQAKILRVVEYGEFQRLGSERILTVNVRLIAATHLPLKQFIENHRFRSDLFYRLAGITIHVPPLRERPSDLRALIGYETKQAARKEGKIISGMTRGALDKLLAYHWPGNLRELNRVVHSAVALAEGEVITDDLILIESPAARSDAAAVLLPLPGAPAQSVPAYLQQTVEDLRLHVAEARHIISVLQRMGGNKRKTARALGISRSTLDRKLGQLEGAGEFAA